METRNMPADAAAAFWLRYLLGHVPPEGPSGGRRKWAGACRFLLEALKDGPRPSREIGRLADESGISGMTLRRARKAAGVEAFRRGFGAGGAWYLRLPAGLEVV